MIISAALFEAQPTINALSKLGLGNIVYESCGVGSISAAKNAHKLEKIVKDQEVIFLGSCGVLGTFEKLELIRPDTVSWQPACLRENISYVPPGIYHEIKVKRQSPWIDVLPQKKVVCSSTISLREAPQQNFKDNEYVENLELYSIIEELQLYARRFACILAITNAVGRKAHESWQMNYEKAAFMTAEFIANNYYETKN